MKKYIPSICGLFAGFFLGVSEFLFSAYGISPLMILLYMVIGAGGGELFRVISTLGVVDCIDSNDRKNKFNYRYNVGLSLCLLHAVFLAYTFYVLAGQTSGLTYMINRVWWALFIGWPFWLVVLVIFYFLGDRKIWRLLVPLGLGIVFFGGIALYILAWIWALANGNIRT